MLAFAAGCGLTTAGLLGHSEGVEGGVADAADVTVDTRLDAGSMPDADATAAEAGPCPTTTVATKAGFCIDRTEVTNAAYARFLATSPDVTGQPSACSWNATFGPSLNWPPAVTEQSLPVVYVDWCDAYAYCAWAGMRLCGKIGGGPVAPDEFKNAGASQWFHACSHGDDGAHAYPYGNAYDASTCNEPSGGRSDAGAYAGCVGGYPGLFDMTGNVWEWEDSCNGDAGIGDGCGIRGGSWENNTIGCAGDLPSGRGDVRPSIGFRCCSR